MSVKHPLRIGSDPVRHRATGCSEDRLKSAAEFMGETKIWQDFYSLAPGLPTSGNMVAKKNMECLDLFFLF